MSEETRIEGGIEWFELPGRPGEEDCQCARCGSSCAGVDCWRCGGSGEVERDSWDGCGAGYYATCDLCHGKGGWWHCVSGVEWCTAHPMAGREHIETTAMSSEAWRES